MSLLAPPFERVLRQSPGVLGIPRVTRIGIRFSIFVSGEPLEKIATAGNCGRSQSGKRSRVV